MSNEEDFEDTEWTPRARIAFKDAGRDLLAAIATQNDFLARAELGTPNSEVHTMNDAVERAAAAYGNAQFDLTGTSGPFGVLADWDEDDDAQEEEDDTEPLPTSFLSVLQRADYGVLDEEAVLGAARKKYLEHRPGQSSANAESEISHLGAALYELAHADGWDSLDEAPGLTPMGSIIQVLVPLDELTLTDDPTEQDGADSNFSVGGAVLFTEQNRYRD